MCVLLKRNYHYDFIRLTKHTDIIECTEGTHNCQQACTNTVGSFTCGCNTGFRLATDGHNCNGQLILSHNREFKLSWHNLVSTQILMSVQRVHTTVHNNVIIPLVLLHVTATLGTDLLQTVIPAMVNLLAHHLLMHDLKKILQISTSVLKA